MAVASLFFSKDVFGFVGVDSVLDIMEDVVSFRELIKVWGEFEVEI